VFKGNGDDWQRYVLQLLGIRYSVGDLQLVPDRDRGDLGIEAFSRDGCVFQCYAAEEPLSTEDLYAKQRSKLTADVNKLVANATALAALLGTVKVRRWIFVVPRLESRRLIAHASNKSETVRQQRLDHIAEDFEITVVTDDYFVVEREKLIRETSAALEVDVDTPSPDELQEFAATQNQLIRTLEEKLGVLPGWTDDSALIAARDGFLAAYLRSLTIRARVEAHHPALIEVLDRTVARAERKLHLRYGPTAGQTSVAPKSVEADFVGDLRSRLPGLGVETTDDLAWGTVADWLMRCPLKLGGD
jgi:hypothetical protein